jgi:hypothetical protein
LHPAKLEVGCGKKTTFRQQQQQQQQDGGQKSLFSHFSHYFTSYL